MPKQYRDNFSNEKNIRYREDTGIYEIRKTIHGVSFFASSKNRDEAIKKFIKKLQDAAVEEALRKEEERAPIPEPLPEPKPLSPLFTHTCEKWLELRSPWIKEKTRKYYLQLFGANIFPDLIGHRIDEVKQSDVQILMNKYISQGKYRTATKIYQTLNSIFAFAVGEELIEKSPMRCLTPPKYEKKKGCALTIAEERELIRLLKSGKNSPAICNALLFLLYTGIRRSELASVKIEDGFVTVICAKTRKGYQEKQRDIPITPMLARLLPNFDIEEMLTVLPNSLTHAMKQLMPQHHLHELRHTFITRCQECGVPREVVSVWAGHAPDTTMTSNVYTHFSREYMQKEAAKVDYDL